MINDPKMHYLEGNLYRYTFREEKVKKIVENDGSKYHVSEIKPIAFGLNSLEFIFMRDESKGDTEPMEKEFVKISGVQSVDVIDVRRAFG